VSKKEFTKWVNIREIEKLHNLDYPGIYAIAYSSKEIKNKTFEYFYSPKYAKNYDEDNYIDEGIIFIEMTKDRSLRLRLNEFINTVFGIIDQHGTGYRFNINLCKKMGKKWRNKLYVSIKPFTGYDPSFTSPDLVALDYRERPLDEKDLEKWIKQLKCKGDIAKAEYNCFAYHVKKCGILPQFNDMKRTPK